MSETQEKHFHRPGLKMADTKQALPILKNKQGNVSPNVTSSPSNVGLLSRFKAFFSRLFGRSGSNTEAGETRGDTKEGNERPRRNIFVKVFTSNGRTRKRNQKKKINSPISSLDLGAIGTPNRKVPESQIIPESGVEDEVSVNRPITMYMPVHVGTSSFDGTGGTVSMLENPPGCVDSNSQVVQGSFTEKSPKPKPPPKSPTRKDIKSGLERFSLSTAGHTSLKTTQQILAEEKLKYEEEQDSENPDNLKPVIRQPGMSSLKRRRSKKRNEIVRPLPRSPRPTVKSPRNGRSRKPIFSGGSTSTNGDSAIPKSTTNSLLTVRTPSESGTRASPEAVVRGGSSRIEKRKKNSSMFSFKTKKRSVRKDENDLDKTRAIESPEGEIVRNLVSQQFIRKKNKTKNRDKKKVKKKKSKLKSLEDGYATPDTDEL